MNSRPEDAMSDTLVHQCVELLRRRAMRLRAEGHSDDEIFCSLSKTLDDLAAGVVEGRPSAEAAAKRLVRLRQLSTTALTALIAKI